VAREGYKKPKKWQGGNLSSAKTVSGTRRGLDWKKVQGANKRKNNR